MSWKIYHNPRCSKSRQTLDLLQQNGIEPQIIEYMKKPPSLEDLNDLFDALEQPSAMVRQKEADFQEHPFDVENKGIVVQNLQKNPILIERPIVVKDGQAVIGRPPENVLKLLSR